MSYSFLGVALLIISVAGMVIAFSLFILWLTLSGLWVRTRSGQSLRRVAVIAAGLAIVASPYVVIKLSERAFILSRVPKPLEVARVEYSSEKRWGTPLVSLPGDNETGFVVYRLTEASARWARGQGTRLGDLLPAADGRWRETPVDDIGDSRLWHPYDHDPQMMSVRRPKHHPPTIQEFLEKYGFTIPIEEERAAEADRAIQSEGSFYSYGRGGSLTVVDPSHGKVYFAYAG